MKRLFLKVWCVNLLLQVGVILWLQHQIQPRIPDHFGLAGPDSFVPGNLFSVLTMILLFHVAALLFATLALFLTTRVPILAQHSLLTRSLLTLVGLWTLATTWTVLPWCFLPAAAWMGDFMTVVDLCFLLMLIVRLGQAYLKQHALH